MNLITRAAAAIWDFLAGDDWVTAVGVVVAIGITALIAATGATAWWVMLVAVPGLLAWSLRRAR